MQRYFVFTCEDYLKSSVFTIGLNIYVTVL
jgi:hypothetical protein